MLTVVDVASRRPIGSMRSVPKVLALSPDARMAAVSHPEAKLVSVVDLRRRTVSRTTGLPAQPGGVAEGVPGRE